MGMIRHPKMTKTLKPSANDVDTQAATQMVADSSRLPTLFTLPREIRDETYGYVFADLKRASYIFGKPREQEWYINRSCTAFTPPILLTSHAVHVEAIDAFYKRFPHGPEIFVQQHPDFCGGQAYRAAKRDAIMAARDSVDHEVIFDLLHDVHAVQMEVLLSSNFSEQVAVIALMRWIVAVLSMRNTPVRRVYIELRISSKDLWPRPGQGFFGSLRSMPCGSMEISCFWPLLQGWESARLEVLCRPRGESTWKESGTMADAEEAWEAVVEKGKLEFQSRRTQGKNGLVEGLASLLWARSRQR